MARSRQLPARVAVVLLYYCCPSAGKHLDLPFYYFSITIFFESLVRYIYRFISGAKGPITRDAVQEVWSDVSFCNPFFRHHHILSDFIVNPSFQWQIHPIRLDHCRRRALSVHSAARDDRMAGSRFRSRPSRSFRPQPDQSHSVQRRLRAAIPIPDHTRDWYANARADRCLSALFVPDSITSPDSTRIPLTLQEFSQIYSCFYCPLTVEMLSRACDQSVASFLFTLII